MRRLSAWLRRNWLSLMLAAIFSTLAANGLLGSHGPRDLIALRSHRYLLEARREHLLADNATLTVTVRRLHSDNRYLERVVRRELGYARPDELVYKFTGDGNGASH